MSVPRTSRNSGGNPPPIAWDDHKPAHLVQYGGNPSGENAIQRQATKAGGKPQPISINLIKSQHSVIALLLGRDVSVQITLPDSCTHAHQILLLLFVNVCILIAI